jgi:fumarate hydratase class I
MVNEVTLQIPLSQEDVLSLKAGDLALLSGSIVTGRDRMHKYLTEHEASRDDVPFDLSGLVLYHCGPVIKTVDGQHNVIAAGPTTSARLEMYESTIIKEFGLRGIMGKGGMGEKTREALKENVCVYFHAIGGAAVFLADRITNVRGVWKLDDFGPTEAMWQFEIRDFPAMVTMDAHGNDIHRDINSISSKKFAELIGL